MDVKGVLRKQKDLGNKVREGKFGRGAKLKVGKTTGGLKTIKETDVTARKAKSKIEAWKRKTLGR